MLFDTNPIVVAKVHDLQIAGRQTELGAPAFEGVRDLLEEEKTVNKVLVLGQLDASANPVLVGGGEIVESPGRSAFTVQRIEWLPDRIHDLGYSLAGTDRSEADGRERD